MALIIGPMLDGGVLITGPMFDGELVLSLPGALHVTIPLGATILYRDHASVMAWLASAVASGGVSVVNDCPHEMLLSQSPITVTFTAIDGGGNQVSGTREINIHQSSAAPVIEGAGRVYKFTAGRHVYIGNSEDDFSRLIDT